MPKSSGLSVKTAPALVTVDSPPLLDAFQTNNNLDHRLIQMFAQKNSLNVYILHKIVLKVLIELKFNKILFIFKFKVN